MLFQNWTYEDYLEQFSKDKTVRFIEPMSAHEININEYIPDEDEFAELKYDGHRGLVFIGDKFRVFSRRVSKKTNWYSENSDQVPHIRDTATNGLFGTVLDGEFDYGNTSMGVQSVMGSLPERAIKFQEENGNITFKAFDILYYKGVNIQKMPLWKRKIYLAKAVMEIGNEFIQYAVMYMESKSAMLFSKLVTEYESDMKVTNFILNSVADIESYRRLFLRFIEKDKEGIMLKSMYGIYEQKRSKAYLKVKGQSTWDCVVMGYTESTKVYDGKELGKWKYWEVDGELMELHGGQAGAISISEKQGVECIPVTKPHFMGWCGGISFGVWKPFDYDKFMQDGGHEMHIDQMRDEGVLNNFGEELRELVQVGDCKGLTEKIMQDIKENGNDYIGKVVEVKANGIIDEEKGSLRHPRFEKWRWDKEPESCLWEDHNRKL